MLDFLRLGGPVLWVLLLLSVLVLAVVIWIAWRYIVLGAWYRLLDDSSMTPVEAAHQLGCTVAAVDGKNVHNSADNISTSAMQYCTSASAEFVQHQLNFQLNQLTSGFRLLRYATLSAPLLGLLGTVLGMIDAFQTLEQSGGNATATGLAGGIWEALLTTAFGMAIAVFAATALAIFDGVVEHTARAFQYALRNVTFDMGPPAASQ